LAPPLFSGRYRVQWCETDAAGFVHFSNFLRYCERAEEDFLLSLGFRYRFINAATPVVAFPRVKAGCEYSAPLRPGDVFRVDIVDVVVGNKSITYRFEVFNESLGTLSARCEIVAVAFSLERGESIPVPEELKQRLLAAGARLRDGAGNAAGGKARGDKGTSS
jgi:acyl-CoA thioester hydrolase